MSINTCECGDYEFFCVYGTVTTQVYPLNFLETSLIDELEGDNIFYRRKFNGELKFGGRGLLADWNYFHDILTASSCNRIDFLIFKDGVPYWEGYISTVHGTWDFDECTFTTTPVIEDDYTPFIEEGDVEYNILAPGEIAKVSTWYENGFVTEEYKENRYIIDVLEYIVDQIVPGTLVASTFFSEAVNPISLTTNRYDKLTIASKSDIKRPNSTNPASIGMLSFNQLMAMLRCMNLYWTYDGVTLTVEYVSYFAGAAGIDTRLYKSALGKSKYVNKEESIYKYERFKWMEAKNTDFLGNEISYGDCAGKNISDSAKEYSFPDLTTDLQFIIDSVADVDLLGSNISDSGWVILANEDVGGTLYILWNYQIANTFPFIIANADMSWNYLHWLFWKHDRQFTEGYMIGILTDFYSSKKNKRQDLSITLCGEDFDPSEELTTELGETYLGGLKGKVGTATIKPYGQIDLALLYGDPDKANPGYTYENYVYLTEIQTDATPYASKFVLMANKRVAAQVDFVFTVEILNNSALTCTSGNITVSILAGECWGTVNYDPWCDPALPADYPYCINDITQISLTAGWTMITGLLNGVSNDSIC